MSGEGYRVLLQARSWSRALRDKGFTWDQITDVLALTYDVSPLRLYRLAHGRTAADVVSMVNAADPAGTCALRESRFYDYETWPATGRRPPARLLADLAEIYETAAHRLLNAQAMAVYSPADRELIDRAEFHHLDSNQPVRPARDKGVTTEADARDAPEGKRTWDTSACMRLLRAIGSEETDVKRRELLFELALVLGGGKALELLRVLTPDEEERLAGVLRSTWKVDEAVVRTFEKLTLHARRADDVSGPASLLPVVNEHRTAVGRLLAHESMPLCLRDRLLGTYVQMSQLAGYMAYDLSAFATAEQSLSDGLRVALDLGDPTLIGYLHYWLGRAAAEQDRLAAILDHAAATQHWAARSPSRLLASLCEGLFSHNHAAAGNSLAGSRAYERALSLSETPKGNEPHFLYWVSPAPIEVGKAWSLLRLGQAVPAMAAAEQCLTGLDPQKTRPRLYGLALTRYAGALILTREIPEAAAKLSAAVDIAARHGSVQLMNEISRARARLTPWADTTYVRGLDEKMRLSGLN